MSAVIPLFNTSTDILLLSDVMSGLTRFGYEKAVGRSTNHALSENVTQVVSFMIGRLVDTQDDRIPIDAIDLKGKKPWVKAIAAGVRLV